MGSYDGAEVCELVGLHLLNLLNCDFEIHNIGLYRDDSFSCFQNILGPDSEKIEKNAQNIHRKRFKHCRRM